MLSVGTSNIFSWHKRRGTKGASTMELVLSAPILIIITIFSLNSAALIFGADFCDRACKDCARAAGQMSTPDTAVNAMNAAAASHTVDGMVFKQISPELVVYEDYNYSQKNPTPKYGSTPNYTGENGINNITPHTAQDDLSDQTKNNDEEGKAVEKKDKLIVPPGSTIGAVLADPAQTSTAGPYVIVRTTLTLRIPVSIGFGKMFAGNVPGDPSLFQFQSVYMFPITNTYVPI